MKPSKTLYTIALAILKWSISEGISNSYKNSAMEYNGQNDKGITDEHLCKNPGIQPANKNSDKTTRPNH